MANSLHIIEKRKKTKCNSYFFHLNGSTYLNKTRQNQGIRLRIKHEFFDWFRYNLQSWLLQEVGSDLSILVIVFYKGGTIFAVCIEKFPGLDAVEKKCRYWPTVVIYKSHEIPAAHLFNFQGRTNNGDSLSMKLRTKNGYFRKHYGVTV